MNQAGHEAGAYAEAVWDTTPIMRMFCAELDGRCACLTKVIEHVYPQKVAEELHDRNRADILGQFDRNGRAIEDEQYATAILNAMRGSMIFHIRKHPCIDIYSVSSQYDLKDTDGEFWVVAYAISKLPDKILVVMDDGPALNRIHGELETTPERQFTLWTSLHIIYRLMKKEQVLTRERGSRLFLEFHENHFRRLNENTRRSLDIPTMHRDVLSKAFRRKFRIAVVKRRPFYSYDAKTQGWTYPPLL